MQVSERLGKEREMRQNTEPWWLNLNHPIIGFEGEDDGGEEEEQEEQQEEEEEEDDQALEALADLSVRDLTALQDLDEDERAELLELVEAGKDPTEGLKSALRKERQARKEAERELKRLKGKGGKPTTPPKKEDEEEDTTNKDADETNAKLARKLQEKAVDTALLRFASQFEDPEDLLRLVNRQDIDVDQDDEDPSEIEVDPESVEEAVKALLKKSPHLAKKTARKGTKSGSQFGGAKKGSKAMSEQELRKKYPALRQ